MMIFVDRAVTAVIVNGRMKVLWYVTRPEGISIFPCVRAHSFEDVFKIIPSIYGEGCLYHPELYSLNNTELIMTKSSWITFTKKIIS